jgi:hypothetical protein
VAHPSAHSRIYVACNLDKESPMRELVDTSNTAYLRTVILIPIPNQSQISNLRRAHPQITQISPIGNNKKICVICAICG